MKNQVVIQLKRFVAIIFLAATFTLMGILFASKWELTDQTQAEDDQSIEESLRASGLVTPTGESPFVAVAQKAMPSVVNITAKKQSGERGRNFDFFDFGPFKDFFPDIRPEVPHGITSGGSGIIIDEKGYIVTNNHVVEGATEIQVKDAEGHDYSAEIVGTDSQTDVALIKIEAGDFNSDHVAELGDSDAIKVGDWAIAIGNPFGLDWTVTVGVISAKGRSNLAISGGGPIYQNFIQTDASINFGNSGGPLINARGEVVGVNTAINTQAQGIGFAIPINLVKNIAEQLRSEGQVVRGYLGMIPRELDDATREALKLERDIRGIFVDMVEDDTPASEGGLKAGDVITHVDKVPVDSPSAFRFMIAERKPGAKMTLDIIRDGDKKRLEFVLGDRSKYVSAPGLPIQGEGKIWLGLHVEPLTSQRARELNLDADYGVLITMVDYDSPAEGKLFANDVIIEINRQAIRDMRDYNQISDKIGDKKDAILFRVIRSGRPTYEAIKP